MKRFCESAGVALAFGLSALTGAHAQPNTPPDTRISPPVQSISWTSFVDPNEHAFSTMVPSNWGVFGGMLRHTAVDPAMYVRLLSPDRRTYLMIGDPGITLFSPPVVSIFGQRQPEGGAVLSYLPGAAFARAYVAREITKLCSNVMIVGQRERPDLAQGPWTRFNPQSRHDGGEVTFTCTHGGEPAHGIVAAATYIVPGGALWSVDFLAGYIAPPDGYDAAFGVIRHIIESTRISPAWLNRQQAMTAQVAYAIDASTQQVIELGEQNLANARRRQHQFDQQFEAFDRIITGVSPYADPSGNIRDGDNTKPYHWIGPGGRTAATEGPDHPPGFGWQPMTEVPPR